MTARDLAAALGARRNGSGWMARCPAHDDRNPSLSIGEADDGKVLVRCHAGCSQEQVIAALRSRGLWGGGGHSYRPPPYRDDNRSQAATAEQKTARARELFRRCMRAERTLGQVYWGWRGFDIAIPPDIRYHPRLWHGPSGRELPALVAAVRNVDGELVAIHRTFLAPNGRGKANVEPNRMVLGPCRGAAVRLAPAAERMAVSEGLETGLSVAQSTGLAVWAAVSAPGLQSLVLPPLPLAGRVIILVDHDKAGQAAAGRAGMRWLREGRRVWRAMPDEVDTDFNDLLRR
jgi:hypothetical protein